MNTLLEKNIKRHVNLNEDEFNIVISSIKRKKISKKEFLIHSGDIVKNTYFVNQGLLRLYQVQESGIEKTALFAKEEWWVTDLYSFLSQNPATHYLQAIETSEVFALSKFRLEELLIKIPKLERFFRIIQQNSFIAQNERIMDMLSKSAEQRYLNFKEKYPKAELRISQKHIASYLGITPEFLSKMKKEMKS